MKLDLSVADLIQILMLIFVSLQLMLLFRSFRADHERRKKESTIEHVRSIRTLYRGLSGRLIDKFGEDAINLSQIDAATEREISEYLSIIEHLSVGVNTEVYDFDILSRMSGTYLVRMYFRLAPYIKSQQKQVPSYFVEFEFLVENLQRRRREGIYDTKGNLIYAPK